MQITHFFRFQLGRLGREIYILQNPRERKGNLLFIIKRSIIGNYSSTVYPAGERRKQWIIFYALPAVKSGNGVALQAIGAAVTTRRNVDKKSKNLSVQIDKALNLAVPLIISFEFSFSEFYSQDYDAFRKCTVVGFFFASAGVNASNHG